LASISHLAGGASHVITVAGEAGLPDSDLLAVAVTAISAGATGPTDVRLGPGPTPPSVPSIETAGPTRSAFAIVPVAADGTITAWNGASATGLTLQVSGWFSSAQVPDSDTAGLFTRLAGFGLVASTVPPGGTQVVPVLGQHDLADHALSAVLVRLRTSAKGQGRLAVGPTEASTTGVTSVAYARGVVTDLAIARLSHGSVVLRNTGAGSVRVTFAAVGEFSSGGDAGDFGDGLTIVDPVPTAAQRIGPAGAYIQTAGIGDVPSVDAAAPPSLSLQRTAVSAPSSTGSLRVDAAGMPASGVEAMHLRKGAVSAGLLLAPPGEGDATTLATSRGQAHVTGEVYGYFGGGTVMAAGLHRLDASAQGAVTHIQPDSLTFSGQPASLGDIQEGDIITSTPIALAPNGLLRSVTLVDRSSGDLVLTTSPASMDQVFQQVDLSLGTSSSTTPPTPTVARRRSGRGVLGPCSLGGHFIGARIECGLHVVTAAYTADISGSIHADLQLLLHVDPNPLNSSFFVQVSGGADVSAEFSALADDSIEVKAPVVESELPVPECSFPIAPGVIMGCHPGLVLEASGTVSNGDLGSGSVSASFTAAYDSATGGSFDHQFMHQGHATALDKSRMSVGVSLVPEIAWKVDESPLEVHAGLPLGVSFKLDGCGVLVSGTLGIEAGLGLDLFWNVGVDFTRSLTASVPLYSMPLHNCAYWTGTIFYKARSKVSSPTTSWQFHTSASGTIKSQPDSPGEGNYSMPTTSTGAKVETATKQCGFGPEQTVVDKINTDWSGPLTYYFVTPGLTIKRVDGGGGHWMVSMPSIGTNALKAKGHETTTTWSPDIFGVCHQTTDGPKNIDEWEYQLFFLDKSQCGSVVCENFVFLAPYGDMSASGSKTFQADASAPAYTFQYTLTKHCTIGRVC
jgi:hypothetical protein